MSLRFREFSRSAEALLPRIDAGAPTTNPAVLLQLDFPVLNRAIVCPIKSRGPIAPSRQLGQPSLRDWFVSPVSSQDYVLVYSQPVPTGLNWESVDRVAHSKDWGPFHGEFAIDPDPRLQLTS
jgi:hypothetical protein